MTTELDGHPNRGPAERAYDDSVKAHPACREAVDTCRPVCAECQKLWLAFMREIVVKQPQRLVEQRRAALHAHQDTHLFEEVRQGSVRCGAECPTGVGMWRLYLAALDALVTAENLPLTCVGGPPEEFSCPAS